MSPVGRAARADMAGSPGATTAELDASSRVRTDWTVRDDMRAKLRSSIKPLLVNYKYPPGKQPDAIRLVIEQMEAMAQPYAA